MSVPRPMAFPSNHMVTDGGGTYLHPGMTLRDWFAGQALACLADGNVDGDPAELAGYVYLVADAMLVERSKA